MKKEADERVGESDVLGANEGAKNSSRWSNEKLTKKEAPYHGALFLIGFIF